LRAGGVSELKPRLLVDAHAHHAIDRPNTSRRRVPVGRLVSISRSASHSLKGERTPICTPLRFRHRLPHPGRCPGWLCAPSGPPERRRRRYSAALLHLVQLCAVAVVRSEVTWS
jgi:hypothetical protein